MSRPAYAAMQQFRDLRPTRNRDEASSAFREFTQEVKLWQTIHWISTTRHEKNESVKRPITCGRKTGGHRGAIWRYWERARELVGMEESRGAGLLPNPMTHPTMATGEPEGVEEAEIQQNLGEFPDRFTDQGAREMAPEPKQRKQAKSNGAKKNGGEKKTSKKSKG